MGMCCSLLLEETKCVKCGCPYYYYNSKEHASRQSCRGYETEQYVKPQYHEWSRKIY